MGRILLWIVFVPLHFKAGIDNKKVYTYNKHRLLIAQLSLTLVLKYMKKFN